MTEEYTTVRATAKRWKVSPMTVYRMVEDGSLRAIRVGGRAIRIPVNAVEEYEKNNLMVEKS